MTEKAKPKPIPGWNYIPNVPIIVSPSLLD